MSVTGPDGACDPLARIINVGSRELQAQHGKRKSRSWAYGFATGPDVWKGLGHRLGGGVTGCSASTNAQLRQGLGVKKLGCSATHLPHVLRPNRRPAGRSPLILAASQPRRLAYASLIGLDQSLPGGALAQSDCTKDFVGLTKPSINDLPLRAELENGDRDPRLSLNHHGTSLDRLEKASLHRAPWRAVSLNVSSSTTRSIRPSHSWLASSTDRGHRVLDSQQMTDHISWACYPASCRLCKQGLGEVCA